MLSERLPHDVGPGAIALDRGELERFAFVGVEVDDHAHEPGFGDGGLATARAFGGDVGVFGAHGGDCTQGHQGTIDNWVHGP